MSNWTHVAAIARIDHAKFLLKDFQDSELDFTHIFGKELNWNAPIEDWIYAEKHEDEYLPLGSEGTLHMSVWCNPDECSLARYTVSMFGDLRDHESATEIIDWFKTKLKNLNVREASIIVENEIYGVKYWNTTWEEEYGN